MAQFVDGALELFQRLPRKKSKLDFNRLKQFVDEFHPTHIVLERPLSLPSRARKSIATMFENFGILKGLFLGTPLSEVSPSEWQSVLKHPGRGQTKVASLALVNELFEGTNIVDDGISDAILIGIYFLNQNNASFVLKSENNNAMPEDV